MTMTRSYFISLFGLFGIRLFPITKRPQGQSYCLVTGVRAASIAKLSPGQALSPALPPEVLTPWDMAARLFPFYR